MRTQTTTPAPGWRSGLLILDAEAPGHGAFWSKLEVKGNFDECNVREVKRTQTTTQTFGQSSGL